MSEANLDTICLVVDLRSSSFYSVVDANYIYYYNKNILNKVRRRNIMDYVYPEKLVSTEWVASHLNDPSVRVVESDEDPLLYPMGHIPGAVQVDWFTTLQHPVRRNFVTKDQFEDICTSLGISNDTTVVFYGDKSNWFAAYALWLFQYFGHQDVRIMNGGRTKWEQENRPLIKEIPS